MAERTVDAYVAALPPDQRDIAEALRGLVKAAAPNAKESIKWAQPVYEDNGPFAQLRAFRNHVNFGFWRGMEVDAGRRLLKTSGSVMADVKLRSAADIDHAALTEMVRKALRLNKGARRPSRSG